MKWRTFLAPAVVSCMVAGCQSGYGTAIGRTSPDGQVAAVEPQSTSVTRFQKADGEAPKAPVIKSFLDVLPERADKGGKVQASIRATVNNQPILEEEVRSAAFQSLIKIEMDKSLNEPEKNKLRAEVYNSTLQDLINRELLLQDAYSRLSKGGQANKVVDKLKESASREFERQLRARKAAYGLKTDEELKVFLRSQGLSLESMRRQFERDYLAREYLHFLIEPALQTIGHPEIVDYYQTHPEEFQGIDQVDWQDIFLDASKYPSREAARQTADQIIGQLRHGMDFKNFMERDDGDSRTRNGEGSGHKRHEIRPPEAEDALFSMHEGDVGPVIEVPAGFHVVRLVRREHPGPLPFDERVQSRIRDKLRAELGNQEIQKTVADLKRKALIEVSTVH